MPLMPSARELLEEAIKTLGKDADLNHLHSETYSLVLHYRGEYYERKVDDFISSMKVKLDAKTRDSIKKAMLRPVTVDEIEYSNFMEEAARRISQTFQVVSGKLAEFVAENALINQGLVHGDHYVKNVERTDIMLLHPDSRTLKKRHRIEIKNVHLRERGVRGLGFDGDSMLGFFIDAGEFSESTVQIIDDFCTQRSGYCYVPPTTLRQISTSGARFRPNTRFASDMFAFVRKGKVPVS